MSDLLAIAPYLGASGAALINLDENTTGADDLAGNLLVYAGDVFAAVVHEEDLPPLPEIVQRGTQEKITGASRVVLIVAASVLNLARFQVAGKASKVLRYIFEAINLLLAGKAVPAPAADLI